MANPEFPMGGVHPLGGRGPPTRVFFGENVCENERIGFHRSASAVYGKISVIINYLRQTYWGRFVQNNRVFCELVQKR